MHKCINAFEMQCFWMQACEFSLCVCMNVSCNAYHSFRRHTCHHAEPDPRTRYCRTPKIARHAYWCCQNLVAPTKHFFHATQKHTNQAYTTTHDIVPEAKITANTRITHLFVFWAVEVHHSNGAYVHVPRPRTECDRVSVSRQDRAQHLVCHIRISAVLGSAQHGLVFLTSQPNSLK